MKLTKLLRGLGVSVENDFRIVGVEADSRKIKKGFVFVAHKGVIVDGHDFIDQAVANGAVAVVGEQKEINLKVPYLRVENSRLAWAVMVANWYGNPEKKLKFVGVTGTDGKTTTSNLIYDFLRQTRRKVGLISTVYAVIGDEKFDTGLHTSSPDPDVLWKMLKLMAAEGCQWVVIETTSHGLDQDRFGNIKFEVGVITNLGSDHLEYHKTLENYAEAKSKLLARSKVAVINKHINKLKLFEAAAQRAEYFDIDSEMKDVDFVNTEGKVLQKFKVLIGENWHKLETNLLGNYNLENILAAIKTAMILGVNFKKIKESLVKFPQLPGRFELIENDLGLNLVVDFAHTEQGMRSVLALIKKRLIKKGERIIVMFGCNGERDKSKRAPMGKVAGVLADQVVVTAEDPRNESPDMIFKDIYKGLVEADRKMDEGVFRIDDRRKAIAFCIKRLAKKGDWVLFLGKGHEQSMNIGGVEKAWNEKEEVKKCLIGFRNKDELK